MGVKLIILLSIFCLFQAANIKWPIEDGYDSFLVMWFGANATGIDSTETLDLIAKHRVGGYGWQQATGKLEPGQNLGLGESHLIAAAKNLNDFLQSKKLNRTLVFVYRHIQVALRLFETTRKLADDPKNNDLWLHDPSSKKLCLAGQAWHTSDPYWNFSNPNAIPTWLETTITELTTEVETSAGVRSVFFDEVDQGFCGYWNTGHSGCEAQSKNLQQELQTYNNQMLTKMVQKLNNVGIIPLLSLDNRLSQSGDGLKVPLPCAIPEDATLDALKGLTWARYYEIWPGSFWVPNNNDLHAAMIYNAILEGAVGIPLLVHVYSGNCPDPGRNIPRPGRLGGKLEYSIATYLIIQTPSSVFSASTDWYDANFCWHPEYDVQYGRPLGVAKRTGSYTWYRNFTMANVEVDVSKGYGAVFLK